MSEQGARPRSVRSAPREVVELRAIKAHHPELADAVDMHIELLELHRRIQSRVPQPWFEFGADVMARHQAEGRPLLRFEAIPLELSDLRLLVRQTAEILRRFGALEDADYQLAQTIGRDPNLLGMVAHWYRSASERGNAVAAPIAVTGPGVDSEMMGQVFTLVMRPFLVRCAEVLQQRPELGSWAHAHCALCGGEADFAVITPAAERHLICGRCTLRWAFEPLTCPYCQNRDRARITSFATTDGQYRVYACDVCRRYLKAFDGRRATRPVMLMVDTVATLPLDAAAIQRGYVG